MKNFQASTMFAARSPAPWRSTTAGERMGLVGRVVEVGLLDGSATNGA